MRAVQVLVPWCVEKCQEDRNLPPASTPTLTRDAGNRRASLDDPNSYLSNPRGLRPYSNK